MVVAHLSVPACLDVDMNQLSILKDREAIDNYEISSDKTEITLYWTYFKKDRDIDISLERVVSFVGPKC
jgi:hypothetical protein